MSAVNSAAPTTRAARGVQVVRFFTRFTREQRWQHWLLFTSFAVLFLTGIVQKYRNEPWSQSILATPERLELVQNIHHIAAIILTLEVIYHFGRGIYLLARRKLSHAIFPEWQDVKDAGHMIQYLLFLTKKTPKYGKYNFEQKLTYWFLFFSIGLMVITGFVIWFPIQITTVLPGSIVPAAKLTHSTEAIVAGVFVLIWHLYHVVLERLNLSMFTGRLNEDDMRKYHAAEYERLTGESAETPDQGGQA
jgi:formate dehydrogenase gamma subunit